MQTSFNTHLLSSREHHLKRVSNILYSGYRDLQTRPNGVASCSPPRIGGTCRQWALPKRKPPDRGRVTSPPADPEAARKPASRSALPTRTLPASSSQPSEAHVSAGRVPPPRPHPPCETYLLPCLQSPTCTEGLKSEENACTFTRFRLSAGCPCLQCLMPPSGEVCAHVTT